MIFYVYSISNPDTNEVFYVGITKDIEKRAVCHKNAKTLVGNRMRELIEIGIRPRFEILQKVNHHFFTSDFEKPWIAKFTKLGHVLLNKHKGIKKVSENQFDIVYLK